MRFNSLTFAACILALGTANLYADSFTATLTTDGDADVYSVIPLVDGEQFTYVNETLGTFADGNLANSSTSTFTATYLDALGSAGVLSVTDVCAHLTVIGPVVPCQAFAFNFDNVVLGDGLIGDATATVELNAAVNAGVGFGDFTIAGGSIAGGSGTVDFNPPPSNTALAPEPSSLCLMATGLAAAAGVVRRRLARDTNPLTVCVNP